MVYSIGAHFSENPQSSNQHHRSHQRADRNPFAEVKINLPKAKTVFETGYANRFRAIELRTHWLVPFSMPCINKRVDSILDEFRDSETTKKLQFKQM